VTRAVGAWIPAATWAAFLFYFSSRSGLPVDLGGGLDKIAHFSAYLVLGLLLMFATYRAPTARPAADSTKSVATSWETKGARGALIAMGIGIVYGITDELHQSMVPGRLPAFSDWVADSAGTVAGVLIYLAIRRRRTRVRPVGAIAEGSST
jgi:VanZ family protein